MRTAITLLILSGCAFEGVPSMASPDSAIPACTAAPSGIVGWWDGERVGVDITGNTISPSLGAPKSEPGLVDRATRFNNAAGEPATDMVRVTDPPTPSQFTLEGWVYLERFHQNWLSLYGRVADACFALYNHSITYWDVDVGVGVAGNVALQPTELGSQVWHHVAVTYDGSTLTTFANGVIAAQQDVDDVELPVGAAGFGGAPNGGLPVTDAWQGMLDELTIYDRPLSSDELLAIVEAGSAGKCKPPN